MPPKTGDAAPEFEGLLCDGETFRSRSLSEAAGDRGTVLIFDGFVFSAIATNWWTRYANAGWHEFDDVAVYGVHRDGPYGVNAFLRERDSPFSIFADVEGSIADAYDLLAERRKMGGVRTARRAIFVLDAEGTVTDVWEAEGRIDPVPRDDVAAAVESL